jgi:hypothetical protein
MNNMEDLANIKLLQSAIRASSSEEMLGKAIALTLQTVAHDRAVVFEWLTREITALASTPNSGMKSWMCFIHRGTDGSWIFRGGTGLCLVVDPEGRLWRARTYEDFETSYKITSKSCEIDKMTPNYAQMREYVVR